jgi:hypothetical protein
LPENERQQLVDEVGSKTSRGWVESPKDKNGHTVASTEGNSASDPDRMCARMVTRLAPLNYLPTELMGNDLSEVCAETFFTFWEIGFHRGCDRAIDTDGAVKDNV